MSLCAPSTRHICVVAHGKLDELGIIKQEEMQIFPVIALLGQRFDDGLKFEPIVAHPERGLAPAGEIWKLPRDAYAVTPSESAATDGNAAAVVGPAAMARVRAALEASRPPAPVRVETVEPEFFIGVNLSATPMIVVLRRSTAEGKHGGVVLDVIAVQRQRVDPRSVGPVVREMTRSTRLAGRSRVILDAASASPHVIDSFLQSARLPAEELTLVRLTGGDATETAWFDRGPAVQHVPLADVVSELRERISAGTVTCSAQPVGTEADFGVQLRAAVWNEDPRRSRGPQHWYSAERAGDTLLLSVAAAAWAALREELAAVPV